MVALADLGIHAGYEYEWRAYRLATPIITVRPNQVNFNANGERLQGFFNVVFGLERGQNNAQHAANQQMPDLLLEAARAGFNVANANLVHDGPLRNERNEDIPVDFEARPAFDDLDVDDQIMREHDDLIEQRRHDAQVIHVIDDDDDDIGDDPLQHVDFLPDRD